MGDGKGEEVTLACGGGDGEGKRCTTAPKVAMRVRRLPIEWRRCGGSRLCFDGG